MTLARRFLLVGVLCSAFVLPEAGLADETRTTAFTAPLARNGLVYTVKVRVNGGATANLVIDTGSSYTVISEKLAASLGYTGLDKAPRAPLATAAGIKWARLIVLDSLSVGGAASRLVEGAVISGLPGGVNGYLGLSYLNQFKYRIDAAARTLTLALPDEPAPLRAGAGQKWWRARFSPLCENIRKYRSYKTRLDNRLKIPRPEDEGAYTTGGLERLVSFYAGLHRARAARAARLGVPEAWIERP